MEKKLDITKMTVEQLKAMAYDEMAQVQLHQQNLSILNQQIESKIKVEQAKEPLEVKETQ